MADTIAVMDAAGIGRAVLVGLCSSAWYALLTAALHPGRVLGVVSIATWVPFLTPPLPCGPPMTSTRSYDTDEGWAKDNRHYWLRDWRGYAEFFFSELLPEPHSTKQREDCVGWAMDSSARGEPAVQGRAASRPRAARRPRPSWPGSAARCWPSTARGSVPAVAAQRARLPR